ncbi:MAG: sulfatase-like hydrolase/transferase [candidate division KSB1 bacterium]|nr:sulfatase-like hydrolase/transferase [candidate division KSB1 bacterium]
MCCYSEKSKTPPNIVIITWVFFTSDNGPWISYGNHAGSTPFRIAKTTSFDGGTRSACIMKYPGAIKAGSSSGQAFCSIDILPTICERINAPLPDHEIDGKNVWDIITRKPGATNPYEYYAFSTGGTFESVMSGDGLWKLHLPHDYRTLVTPGNDGQPGRYKREHIELSLFDLVNDPYETNNVIRAYPGIAKELQQLAKRHQTRFYSGTAE